MSVTLFEAKRIEHILFAIFCGSIAMVAVQNLSADYMGHYQYLLAIGTCATCSVIWLIAIALFRGQAQLKTHHYAIALCISLLVVLGYSIDLFHALSRANSTLLIWFERVVAEVSALFSSTVLMLTLWEALNGFRVSELALKRQRAIFAIGFFIGFFNCTVVARAFVPESLQAQLFPMLVATSAMMIMCATFWVILLQRRQALNNGVISAGDDLESPVTIGCIVFRQIEQLMLEERLFLNDDLKIRSIAQRLKVSDYKVGEAIRTGSNAANFNQFVNGFRIEYAKKLLKNSKATKSTILAISLKSGFASIAPFNRAFKLIEGCTPNEYRKRQQV